MPVSQSDQTPMASQDRNPERVLSVLAHQPRHIINGVITITEEPVKPAGEWRTSASSSLGDLDNLPLELLHVVFTMLDFRTLSHISRTCLRGIQLVNSLPEYRDLMQHAPRALVALGKTMLLRHHLVATVHAALLSANCVSCNRYGAFLFLPTCERCCYHCLWANQSLRVIPMTTARKCFGFSAAGAKTLPLMRSVPGKYFVRYMVSRPSPRQLVCVGHAKKLAIAEGRSEESMRQELERRRSAGEITRHAYHEYSFFQKAPLTPPGVDLFVQPSESNVPNDKFCGMASLPFPFLTSDKTVEHGIWCLGCELFNRKWVQNGFNTCPDHLSDLILPGHRHCLADDIVYRMQEIAWSKAELLRHVDNCPGAKKLLNA